MAENPAQSVKPPTDPTIGCRVPPEVRDDIDRLRDVYTDGLTPDGRATRSAVLRAILAQGRPMLDRDTVIAVRALAAREGVEMPEAWRRVIAAGLGTPTPDPEAGGIDLDITEAQVARVEALARERGWTTPDTFRRLLAAGLAALTAEPAKGKRVPK